MNNLSSSSRWNWDDIALIAALKGYSGANLPLALQQKLLKAGIVPQAGQLAFCHSLEVARNTILEMRSA
jgi:hypothetical protein